MDTLVVPTERPCLYAGQTAPAESLGQCDCACATAVAAQRPAAPWPTHMPYRLSAPGHAYPLRQGYTALIRPAAAPVVVNASALAVARHFEEPHPLTDTPPVWRQVWGEAASAAIVQQFLDTGWLVPAGASPAPVTENVQTLSAWLHLTGRCNLQCGYCYRPHSQADMTVETGQAAIAAALRSARAHAYGTLKLKYAGGEPLLCWPVVRQLHQFAREQAQRHGLAVEGVVLTNGTRLNAGIARAIRAAGLRLMISLDGVGAAHDAQRAHPNQRGSFAEVTRGIDAALAAGLTPEISVTITSQSAGGLAQLTQWLLDRALPFGFNFYREPEAAASGAAARLDEQATIEGVLAAFQVIEARLPRQSLLAALTDRANLGVPHLRPCGAGQHYLAFDPDGQVAKCQMQLSHPVTTVQAPDPLAVVRADPQGLQNLPVDAKADCQACEWKYWCAGGCPLTAFNAHGRYTSASPHCRIYQALFPQVVRLEGLRLLKWAEAVSAD